MVWETRKQHHEGSGGGTRSRGVPVVRRRAGLCGRNGLHPALSASRMAGGRYPDGPALARLHDGRAQLAAERPGILNIVDAHAMTSPRNGMVVEGVARAEEGPLCEWSELISTWKPVRYPRRTKSLYVRRNARSSNGRKDGCHVEAQTGPPPGYGGRTSHVAQGGTITEAPGRVFSRRSRLADER